MSIENLASIWMPYWAICPLLKNYGFNMIKIQEHWSADEVREGEYDFSRIERLVQRADELDLGIYLGLTMEQAPAWVWKKFPDCHFVYADGRSHNQPAQYTIPMDGKPGPCWDHPGVRAAATRFIAELARTLGQYRNIWAWNTFQEIGFWPNTAGKLGFCYCPHTLARFREWLREKYDSLEALNATWQINYGEWEEVEPPRREEPLAPFIDWRYFMDDVYMARAWASRPRHCAIMIPSSGRYSAMPIRRESALVPSGRGRAWRISSARAIIPNGTMATRGTIR